MADSRALCPLNEWYSCTAVYGKYTTSSSTGTVDIVGIPGRNSYLSSVIRGAGGRAARAGYPGVPQYLSCTQYRRGAGMRQVLSASNCLDGLDCLAVRVRAVIALRALRAQALRPHARTRIHTHR